MEYKQYEVLQWASLFLEKNNRESRVAELLLQHHLNMSRSQFHLHMRESIPEDIVHKFKSQIREHADTGIPVQHLIGFESFYGRDFEVNKHVLVPRPETEELVQHVIGLAHTKKEPLTVVDIGTGSGVIAITLAKELPEATVLATDISADALAVAKHNATKLDADVSFYQGDFLEPIMDQQIKVDLVVSNPPYIPWNEEELLTDTVKDFDPTLALFADDNGLAAYRKIIAQLPHVLKDGGHAAFEIGYQQGMAVKTLLKNQYPESEVTVLQDINGKDRIVSVSI